MKFVVKLFKTTICEIFNKVFHCKHYILQQEK